MIRDPTEVLQQQTISKSMSTHRSGTCRYGTLNTPDTRACELCSFSGLVSEMVSEPKGGRCFRVRLAGCNRWKKLILMFCLSDDSLLLSPLKKAFGPCEAVLVVSNEAYAFRRFGKSRYTL